MKVSRFNKLFGVLWLVIGAQLGSAAPEASGGVCGGLPPEMGSDRMPWADLHSVEVKQLPGALRSALSAAGDDRFKLHQVATLALYWSVWETFPVQRVQFFPMLDAQGHLTPEAREFFFGRWSQVAGLWGKMQVVPTEKVIAFEQKVAGLPSSEQFVAMAIFRNQDIRDDRFSGEHQEYLEDLIEIAQSFSRGDDDFDDTRPMENMQVALHARYGNHQQTAVAFTSFSAYNTILTIYAPNGEVPFQLQPFFGIPRRHQLISHIARGIYGLPVPFPGIPSLLEPNGHYRGGFGSFVLTFEHAADAARQGIPKPVFNMMPRLYTLVDRYAIALQSVQKFIHQSFGMVMDSTVAVEHVQLNTVQLSLTDLNFSSIQPAQTGTLALKVLTWFQDILLVQDIYLENKEVGTHIPGGDIGPAKATGPTLMAWVVVDMAKHPEIYEAAGVPSDIVQELGPEAQALYRAILYNDVGFFQGDQARSSKFHKMAWDISRLLD